jgi:hypothetical protein
MIALFLAAATAALAAGAPQSIAVIPLHPGVNSVPGFTADGRAAAIVQGWRENGNAHGYNTFQVLVAEKGGTPSRVVDVDGPQHAVDLISDDPFDGERQVGVVRFARAVLDGRRQTVLITADLDQASSPVLADHATATIKVFRLVRDESVGSTWDRFALAWSTTTTARYCNVQLALRDTLGVALPRDFDAANKVDGCF